MTKTPNIFGALVCVSFVFCISNLSATSPPDPAAPAEAERLVHTPEGAAYGKAFAAAVARRFMRTLNEGTVRLKLQPPQQVDVTFILSASGQITDTLVPANQPLSTYIAQKFIGAKGPKPPHGSYPVRVRISQRQTALPAAY